MNMQVFSNHVVWPVIPLDKVVTSPHNISWNGMLRSKLYNIEMLMTGSGLGARFSTVRTLAAKFNSEGRFRA